MRARAAMSRADFIMKMNLEGSTKRWVLGGKLQGKGSLNVGVPDNYEGFSPGGSTMLIESCL